MKSRKKLMIVPAAGLAISPLLSTDAAADPPGTNKHPTDDREQCEDSPQSHSDANDNCYRTERRKAMRFPLVLAATIRWLGSDGTVQEAFGTVCNISTSGVFVAAAPILQTKTNVELEMAAIGVQPGEPTTELHFEGKIIRTDTRAARRGFAVAGFLWLAKLRRRVC